MTFWGALAMAATAGIGRLFGAVVRPSQQRRGTNDTHDQVAAVCLRLDGLVEIRA